MAHSVRPPADIPDEWEPVRLKDVAEIHPGGRLGLTKKDDYVEEGVPAFSASGQDGYVEVSEATGEAVVLSSIGARCGRTFLATGSWTTLANTQVIRPGDELDAQFLHSYTNDEDFWLRSGSAQPYIKSSTIKNAWIPLPPLSEQKKIAAILSSVDDAIAATRKVIEQTKRVKKGLLQDLMTRGIGHTRFNQTEIGKIPEEWEVVRFDRLATVQGGYAFPSRSFVDPRPDSVPIVRMSNLKGGRLDLSEAAHVPEEELKGRERYRLTEGDFVFGMSGSLGNYATIRSTDLPCYLNQRVGRIDFHSGSDPRFVKWLFLSRVVQDQLEALAAGAAQLNISASQVESVHVPAPPDDEQSEIGTLMSNLEARIWDQEATESHLEHLKRGLMQDLLTGRVRVSID